MNGHAIKEHWVCSKFFKTGELENKKSFRKMSLCFALVSFALIGCISGEEGDEDISLSTADGKGESDALTITVKNSKPTMAAGQTITIEATTNKDATCEFWKIGHAAIRYAVMSSPDNRHFTAQINDETFSVVGIYDMGVVCTAGSEKTLFAVPLYYQMEPLTITVKNPKVALITSGTVDIQATTNKDAECALYFKSDSERLFYANMTFTDNRTFSYHLQNCPYITKSGTYIFEIVCKSEKYDMESAQVSIAAIVK